MRVDLGGRRRASQTGLSNLSPSLSRARARYSFERMTSREKRRFLSLFLCVVVVVASVYFMGDTAVFCFFVFVAALRLLVVS